MDLQKYKVCPACGEHNPPNLLECRKCESDLTGIKVVDRNTEQRTKGKVKEDNTVPGELVLARICECGAQNPPQARKCKVCGEDISDIMPTTVIEEDQKAFIYELKAIGDDYSIAIDKPVCIVGREADIREYLKNKSYVSRQHAKFTIVAEKVFVENLSNTNKTFVNNVEIAGDGPTALSNGDEIGLGGLEIAGCRQESAAYFIFNTKE